MPSAALLVIDMLNPYDHEDADALAAHAASVVGHLVEAADCLEALRSGRA